MDIILVSKMIRSLVPLSNPITVEDDARATPILQFSYKSSC